MDLKIKVCLLSLATILNGCTTATKSTLLGAAIGGLAGGTIGQFQSQSQQGTASGMAVGAGIGSLIGYLAYKDKVAKMAKDEKVKLDGEDLPFLTRPKIRSLLVPDTIEGNKYIKSHRVFILEDAGSWSKD